MTSFNLVNRFYEKEEFVSSLPNIKFIKTNKKIEYGNVACTIDIESSSFIDNDGNKTATMYAFTLGINGISYLGRTYEDLLEMLNIISLKYGLVANQKHLIFYVHNLGYEFQFFRKWFNWIKVFSLAPREPLKAICDLGIELRCSYLLSGYGLETVGKHLTKYPVDKKVGDLDYRLIRLSTTPLTETEKGYILNDGLVVMAYIQESIESHGNITKLPMTKTGEVRKYCRDSCLYASGHKKDVSTYINYHRMMLGLSITSLNEYKQLKRAFMGGFTHANGFYTDKVVNNVTSFDFTSAYPSVMITEKYPMGRGELIELKSKEEFFKNIELYCCIFDVTFYNIEETEFYEHPISTSQCYVKENFETDNGRLVRADKVSMTITEQDYFIFKKFYKWDKMTVKNFRRYKRGYLPTPFVKSILDLYKKKTELKGVKGSELEYMYSKEQLNSCYGMCVTNICRDEITYDTETGEWGSQEPNYIEQLEKYNKNKQRFLSYAWGIYVTAYNRRNLFTAIYECKNDYVYSDTDSVKIRNKDKHIDYFNRYNEIQLKKLEKSMKHHKLPMEYVTPKTIKGTVKVLGVWDEEGTYQRFKTLGAKRYMVEEDNEVNITVSGLNKRECVPYLYHEYKTNDKLFEIFTDNLYIPNLYQEGEELKCATGKRTHTYIDVERKGTIKDYLGNYGNYYDKSSIHIIESDYSLSLSNEYINYLFNIRLKEL